MNGGAGTTGGALSSGGEAGSTGLGGSTASGGTAAAAGGGQAIGGAPPGTCLDLAGSTLCSPPYPHTYVCNGAVPSQGLDKCQTDGQTTLGTRFCCMESN